MNWGWPFLGARRESKAAAPLIALSQLGVAAWGERRNCCGRALDIGDGNAGIAFRDFRREYLIADRRGARMLCDPYSAKPYVLFYTSKRVGSGVQSFDAIKAMVFYRLTIRPHC